MIFSQSNWKKHIAILTIFTFMLFSVPLASLADVAEGETIVTLGESLSAEQKKSMLAEMGVDESVQIVTVTNQEEHQYLGKYISKGQIGTRAISSSKITFTKPGSGINVTTKNITWVSDSMYANALATAGVKDADIYVTAPFNVSGTAGLTGILKAFEVAADIKISEEQKQAANEEMVTTAELGEKIGSDEAAELLRRLKEELANTTLVTDEDYRNLILKVAQELGVQLTEEDIQALIHLLKRLKELNIDWDQVSNQLINIKENLNEILNKEETQNFIRTVLDFLIGLIEQLKSLFGAKE